jgi:hypothetical protein
MAINKCELGAIKSRAEKGRATSRDCCDLLEYMRVALTPEQLSDKIECAVSRAIEGAISEGAIIRAVERAVRDLKS